MISWKKAYYYFMFTMVSSLAYNYFLMTRLEKCRLIWKLLKYHWKIAGNWEVSAPDLKKIPLRIPFNEVTYALKTMTWNFSKSELSQRNFLESFCIISVRNFIITVKTNRKNFLKMVYRNLYFSLHSGKMLSLDDTSVYDFFLGEHLSI